MCVLVSIYMFWGGMLYIVCCFYLFCTHDDNVYSFLLLTAILLYNTHFYTLLTSFITQHSTSVSPQWQQSATALPTTTLVNVGPPSSLSYSKYSLH